MNFPVFFPPGRIYWFICALEVEDMDKDIDDLIFGGEDPGPSQR